MNNESARRSKISFTCKVIGGVASNDDYIATEASVSAYAGRIELLGAWAPMSENDSRASCICGTECHGGTPVVYPAQKKNEGDLQAAGITSQASCGKMY